MTLTTVQPTLVYQFTKEELDALLKDAMSSALEATTPQQPTTDPDKLYTDIEVQARVKVSRIKLWKDRKAGRLPFIRLGNMIRYRESDIQEYLKKYNPKLSDKK